MIMGLTKKKRKIQNGSIFKIITYFINCGEYAFLRFTTIWIFHFIILLECLRKMMIILGSVFDFGFKIE
jgi:hypothetical protein